MYLKLFSCCKVVTGAKFSIILDTQRQSYFQIPDTMSEIIDLFNDFSIPQIRESLNVDSIEVFDSYINFLIENEFAFYTDTPNEFAYKEISQSYSNDNMNCVIEISTIKDLEKYISAIKQIKVQATHINCYTAISFEQLGMMMDQIMSETAIISVSLSLTSDPKFDKTELNRLQQRYPILNKIYIHYSGDENKNNSELLSYITKSPKKSCGSVDSCFFSCNQQSYQEAKSFNSCLNNKISIDKDGFIKNCLSMSQSFGNINDNVPLESAIDHPKFKQYWRLTKDSIDVCKDCEFRYICTDCRAYTDQTSVNNDGLDVSKPLKCGYDPYTGHWNDWNANLLKKAIIQYYELDQEVTFNR